MIVELFIVSQALQNFLRSSSGKVSPFQAAGATSQCPRVPKPASAMLDIPFAEVPTFKDLGLLIPTTAVNGVVAPTTGTTGWEILTGAGARDVEYVIDISPEDQAAFREQEKIKQALR